MKIRKLILGALFFIVTFLLLYNVAVGDGYYDDEFNKAAALRGKEAVLGTDYLIKSTTEVLHKENMKTHAELEKLRREIEELKKAIREVKDIVEGGG